MTVMNEMVTLDDMLTIYRDMSQELAPMLKELKDLENAIKGHVKETGETGNVDGVTVKIRNGYERSTWDSKALKGYAVAHPEIAEFCKITVVGPSVSIKVG
jgi:hypothetical protein